ncbi:MAG: hypothetical protein GXP55_10960 [Deltaproteobacteria bacterium]|nr:hypothetical protein [Deltaproteobacteria bacterium]
MFVAAATLASFARTPAGQAQVPTPAPEDMALVSGLLADRLDVTPERVVYVAADAGPDGAGTRADPRRDLLDVFANAEAGTAINLAPGVYDMPAIRDRFGHDDSSLFTRSDGAPGRPIVMRTDPELYDPESAIAVLDFGYDNDSVGWRTSAVIVRNSYWVFERFEMRRMRSRGFWVGGYNNTFRELDVHHADTDGFNNEGLILMQASGGETNNVILQNHLHHIGNIDRATDTLIDRGGGNGGCFYTETRLSYDSVVPAAGDAATLAEWEAGILPPDSHVYLIGNWVHDCHKGLGIKNNGRGPYFFLSNYITDVDLGIATPFTDNLIRNNVLVGAGIVVGKAFTNAPLPTFLKTTGNGARSEVAYNTLIGGNLSFRGGWSSRVHNNLVVDAGPPVQIARNQYPWFDGGAWPGIRGEFLIADLTPAHPFYDLMPGYMHELAAMGTYVRMRLEDNCYDEEPAIASTDFRQDVADVTGMVFDERYTVLSASQRSALFVDEATGDYRRPEGSDLDCGSRLGFSAALPPDLDAGVVGVDAGADAATPAVDGGASVDAGTAGTGGGCGCVVAGARRRELPAWPFVVGLVALVARMRTRSRRRG